MCWLFGSVVPVIGGEGVAPVPTSSRIVAFPATLYATLFVLAFSLTTSWICLGPNDGPVGGTIWIARVLSGFVAPEVLMTGIRPGVTLQFGVPSAKFATWASTLGRRETAPEASSAASATPATSTSSRRGSNANVRRMTVPPCPARWKLSTSYLLKNGWTAGSPLETLRIRASSQRILIILGKKRAEREKSVQAGHSCRDDAGSS